MVRTVESSGQYELGRYYEGVRGEMLEFLPKKLERILEIGCGEAGFAEAVKRLTGAEAWGLELNQLAAGVAAERLDQLLLGDVISQMDNLPDQYFDCIVMNDVIEHLIDPEECLTRLKEKLVSGGVIVCSIPNVRHYTNLYNMLFKKQWRYEDAGILDRTHLRFFTEKSIREMFVRLGFNVQILKGINRTTHRTPRVVNALTLGWLSDAMFLQFGCRVSPR
ncbi:MAG: class I SAM-dependent methyltransferase [Gammaproteobacteria bacterium]|nr:class I SAM-dependent methyltransferase [Gammaproteobacteria bacterium]